MVQIYLVDVTDKDNCNKNLVQLPIQEQNKVMKYKNKKNFILALTSRLLQRHIIRRHDCSPTEIYRVNGKPLHPNVYFNVSHDATYVVGCSANCSIGIDITDTTRDLTMHSFRRYFKDSEWKRVITRNDFAHYWTAKEAFSKMDGRGIELIERIEISGNHIIFDEIIQPYTLQWFSPWKNIMGCICSNDNTNITYHMADSIFN